MLKCQAYAVAHGLTYGGACPKWKRRKKFIVNNYEQQRNDMIRMLGLNFQVYLECPKGAKIVLDEEYSPQGDMSPFAPEYMDYLRSISQSASDGRTARENNNKRPRRITVHIRRGDVTPTGPFGNTVIHRYLPNQHYLKLIQLYKHQLEHNNITLAAEDDSSSSEQKKEVEVIIFSESESFESFDEFRDLGYKIELDGSLENVWRTIIFDSDVVITSRSDFSLMPAVLSQALSATPPIVVYTQMPREPLPQFHNVGVLYPDIQSSTDDLYRQMCEQINNNAQGE